MKCATIAGRPGARMTRHFEPIDTPETDEMFVHLVSLREIQLALNGMASDDESRRREEYNFVFSDSFETFCLLAKKHPRAARAKVCVMAKLIRDRRNERRAQ